MSKPAKPDTTEASYSKLRLALYRAVGRFCSFCEKPLRPVGYLFHKQRGEVTDKTDLALADWPQLLLICGDCLDNKKELEQKSYLWPDEVAAGDESPYSYVKRNTLIKFVDDEGLEVSETRRDFIFVETRSAGDRQTLEAARNTIELFQLNGKFYNNKPDQPVMTIALGGGQAFADLRMEDRYRAYRDALESGQILKRAYAMAETDRGYFEDTVLLARMLINASGFASTWLVGLSEVLELTTLLLIFNGGQGPKGQQMSFDFLSPDEGG